MQEEEKAINDLLVPLEERGKQGRKKKKQRRQEQSTVIEDSKLNVSQSYAGLLPHNYVSNDVQLLSCEARELDEKAAAADLENPLR